MGPTGIYGPIGTYFELNKSCEKLEKIGENWSFPIQFLKEWPIFIGHIGHLFEATLKKNHSYVRTYVGSYGPKAHAQTPTLSEAQRAATYPC